MASLLVKNKEQLEMLFELAYLQIRMKNDFHIKG